MEATQLPGIPNATSLSLRGREELLGRHQLRTFLSQPQEIPPKTSERDQYGRQGYRFGSRPTLLKHLFPEEVT